MAKHRTRQAKQVAAERRQLHEGQAVTFALPPATEVSHTTTNKVHPPTRTVSQAFFGYPVNLIYQDLSKTIVVTSILIGVIVFLAWRY